MSSITTINSTDLITNSRSTINTNFSNLNTDKIETSVLDTDTTLAANSDSKIATQKAVKAYIDAGGNVNASTTQRGIVEEATSAEMIAGTAAGGTGARLFLNPSLVAETGADKIVKTKSTGKLDTSIMPALSLSTGVTTKDCSATTTTTIAHGLGTAPTLVQIDGKNSTTGNIGASTTYYFNSVQSSNHFSAETGSGTQEISGTTFSFYANPSGGNALTGAVTVDATNITITWSGTTFTGSAYLIWTAFK